MNRLNLPYVRTIRGIRYVDNILELEPLEGTFFGRGPCQRIRKSVLLTKGKVRIYGDRRDHTEIIQR